MSEKTTTVIVDASKIEQHIKRESCEPVNGKRWLDFTIELLLTYFSNGKSNLRLKNRELK